MSEYKFEEISRHPASSTSSLIRLLYRVKRSDVTPCIIYWAEVSEELLDDEQFWVHLKERMKQAFEEAVPK